MLEKNVMIESQVYLQGAVTIPPSKSLSHRVFIAAGLSSGKTLVKNVKTSDDILATMACLEQLNVSFEEIEDGFLVGGNGGCLKTEEKPAFYCKESGSTLRFMIPLGTLSENEAIFHGEGVLKTRPIDGYLNIFKEQGLDFDYSGTLPLKVKGKLRSGEFKLPGNVSSQYITGLLMTLPLLEGDSTIHVTTDLESKSYVDLTIDTLKDFGIEVVNDNHKTYHIKGNQKYKASNSYVEGDYSQVAFWLVAGLLNGHVQCKGLSLESKQGDKSILDILKRMQADVQVNEDVITSVKSNTVGTVIDGSQCPDIIPILAVLASVSEGETRIINAGRLRIKECDRLKATATELTKLGADIKETEDGLHIIGRKKLLGGRVTGWNDHRIVMSMAVASLVCENPVYIQGSAAITKSYPHFFQQFQALGGKVHEWHLEE